MDENQKPSEGEETSQPTSSSISRPTVRPSFVAKGTESKAGQQQPDNRGDPANPIFVQLLGGDESKIFEQENLAISRESLAISKRTYWITVLGFLAALAAAVFVGSQVKEMSYQTQIMASQSESAAAGASIDEMNTRRQLEIAQKQAVAAQNNVAAVRQQMIASQRPWFGVLDMRHDKPDLVLPPSKFWLIVTNTGRSPALAATHRFTTGIFKTFPKDPPYPKLPAHSDTIEVLPGVTMPTSAINRPPFEGTEEDDIVAGKKTFYVYAILRYKDPITKRTHTTKYCAMWSPLELDSFADPNNPTGSFAICPFYNDAD